MPGTSPITTAQNKDLMIKALSKTRGIVTRAAKLVGITYKTHYEWMKIDPEYAERVKAVEFEKQDFIEDSLMNLIANGDTAATIFESKTINKNRGYIERKEVTGADGEPLMPTINIIKPE